MLLLSNCFAPSTGFTKMCSSDSVDKLIQHSNCKLQSFNLIVLNNCISIFLVHGCPLVDKEVRPNLKMAEIDWSPYDMQRFCLQIS